MTYPAKKLSVIGGGIIAAMRIYYAFQEAERKGERLRVSLYEKNERLQQTTTANIAPSLTPDEILSVVPRGQELKTKLGLLFSEPGGIRVDDVEGLKNSKAAQAFIEAVLAYSDDEQGHKERTTVLLQFGKLSMDFWNQFYEEADAELQQILKDSNFKPCREPKQSERQRHDGYRIDLIYNVNNAAQKAEAMKRDYEGLGYQHCTLLTPAEVKSLDPSLSLFCQTHSIEHSDTGERVWKLDAIALWRPGGCIDTHTFLPKFYDYLQRKLGYYTNAANQTKACFQVHYNREVTRVYTQNQQIEGLGFSGQSQPKYTKPHYQDARFEFFPGENVGTLSRLGFAEPVSAGFAGPSLTLKIPLPQENQGLDQALLSLNHCMEVHQEGVVLAWQARIIDQQIVIRVAGTKAFYGDIKPEIHQEFAKNRNLLQLNIINHVLPQAVSLALHRETQHQDLTLEDLSALEAKGIATRWVGTRAVAYDGFPAVGPLYSKDSKSKIHNGWTATLFSSGGVSFAIGGVKALERSQANQAPEESSCLASVLQFGNAKRG